MRVIRPLSSLFARGFRWVKRQALDPKISPLSLIELGLITAWAFWVGRDFLNFDPSAIPHGGDFSLTIQPNTIWKLLSQCGPCMLWNGSMNGGFPTFAETHSAFLHPLVVATTLIWGALNGAKITLILSLAMAGWAQWWIARSLNLGPIARLWSAGMAVVGGHLAGRMELGLLGIVFSTASCSLVIAAGVNLAIKRQRSSMVALAITLSLAILSGQGYAQVGLLFGIFPAFAIFTLNQNLKPNRQFKQFVLAIMLALLICGILLVPTLHFMPNFEKEADITFRASQPMGYTILNLIIRDIPFFHNESLGKMLFPAIYINYIGWPAIILAVSALWLTPTKKRKPLAFFALAFILVLILSSKELVLFLSNKIPAVMGMYRYPPLVAGLLVPLVLSMAALSLDRLTRITWPKVSLENQKGSRYQIPIILILLAIPLSLNLINAYRFGQSWLKLREISPDFQQLGSAIPNPGSGWIQALSNPHHWTFELIEDGHKVTNVFRPWHWKHRQNPPPSYRAFSPQEEIETGEIITMVDEIRVIEYSDVFYAYIQSGVDEFIPCTADSRGGFIDVHCSTQKPGRLILRENTYPGWLAYRDGEKIELIGENDIEVVAPQGDHHYTFRYFPIDVLLGFSLTLIGIGLSIAILRRGKVVASDDLDDESGSLQEKLIEPSSPEQPQLHHVDDRPEEPSILSPDEAEPQDTTRVNGISRETGNSVDTNPGLLTRTSQWFRTLDTSWFPFGKITLGQALLVISIGVYAASRLINLADYPIYFFSDEAVQTVLASDFIRDGFYGYDGVFLPTYFENAMLYNLSLSVYIQVIPYLLFGKSIFITRAVSALISLSGAYAISLILKRAFNFRHSWIGLLVFSILPAWFLHSRTAFETVLFVSTFIWMIYFYFRYRLENPRFLYLVIVFAALAFYSYRGGQIILFSIGILLFISDWSYNRRNLTTLIKGSFLALFLFLPYLRFHNLHSEETYFQLRMLGSYWFDALPLTEKIKIFVLNYLQGLNPAYWFSPNPNDLSRHLMKGYGHILLLFLPLFFIGLLVVIRNFRQPEYRVVGLLLLVSPLGGAIVTMGIPRVLVFLVPAAILISLGFYAILTTLERIWDSDTIAVSIFGLMLVFHASMLSDALFNGPTWFDDYGMTGMQYGSQQVFTSAAELAERPYVDQVFVSPTWANGTDILMRYFIADGSPVSIANATGVLESYQPELMGETYFVLTPPEYQELVTDPKIDQVLIERVLEYPDGRPGFFFIRFEYASDAEHIFAAERLERSAGQEKRIMYLDRSVLVEYPYTDMGELKHIFDDDTFTMMRVYDANPAIFRLTFGEPIDLTGVKATTGSMDFILAISLASVGEVELLSFSQEFRDLPDDPTVEISFGRTLYDVEQVVIEIESLTPGDPFKIHVRELELY
ncbi:MAG: hypothetical protein E3J69_08120 [Anaerolineales bacterium]|nr:MAG: hypothetical protein E3J69_08120 [Anaerolineales bacterium]